jgi:hypothetical protein
MIGPISEAKKKAPPNKPAAKSEPQPKSEAKPQRKAEHAAATHES